MAFTVAEEARVKALEDWQAAVQSATKSPSELTGTEKRELIDNVFPNGVAIDINDPNIKVGDKVFGNKAEINGGLWCFGVVLTAALTDNSHMDFKYREV